MVILFCHWREEIEKQQAKARYQQLHMEGKTDEARADLARLAIIRKQREDAAKKREEERKGREKPWPHHGLLQLVHYHIKPV